MKKAYWFIILVIFVVALETIVLWGMVWWVGHQLLGLPQLPWWLCLSIVILANIFEGREQSKAKKAENSKIIDATDDAEK